MDKDVNLLSTPWFDEWAKDYFRGWFIFLDSSSSALALELELSGTDYLKDSIVPASGFFSFNQYYSREFIRRPVDPNERNFISPVDGCVLEVSNVSTSPIANIGGFKVNPLDFFRSSNYSSYFSNGFIVHQELDNNGNSALSQCHDCTLIFLGYHRFHSPLDGTILEISIISENISSDLSYSKELNNVIAIEGNKFKFFQSRCMIILSTSIGKV